MHREENYCSFILFFQSASLKTDGPEVNLNI